MRQVGSIEKLDQAERFIDFLHAEGIACSIDQGTDEFRIWVQNDDQVATAKEELLKFQMDPSHGRYRDAARRAAAKLRENQQRRQEVMARTVNVSDKWKRPVAESCPGTIGLVALTCVVAFFTQLEPKLNDRLVSYLVFSTDLSWDSVQKGELWRLITPIFLHFNLTHFVFNMLALWQFGMLIEYHRGTARFLAMVLVITVLSNFAQFYFSRGFFGGMSGVDYGLFGYLWIKGHLEPNSEFRLPQQTVLMMLVWYVLCIMGVIPRIANWAHGIGLLTGVMLAFGGLSWKSLLRQKYSARGPD